MKKKAEILLVRGNKAISITTPTTAEHIEKARAELAAKCLRGLVAAAEERTDPARGRCPVGMKLRIFSNVSRMGFGTPC